MLIPGGVFLENHRLITQSAIPNAHIQLQLCLSRCLVLMYPNGDRVPKTNFLLLHAKRLLPLPIRAGFTLNSSDICAHLCLKQLCHDLSIDSTQSAQQIQISIPQHQLTAALPTKRFSMIFQSIRPKALSRYQSPIRRTTLPQVCSPSGCRTGSCAHLN